ncbi:MAG: hypothetical protein LBQ70_01030 [Prevotellaceae bacterium]|nr:hypothetical protein [Prevotellaceae bacterium]
MNKYLFYLLLLLSSSVYGQQIKNIRIKDNKNKSFALSEIAGSVIPVSIADDIQFDRIDNVLCTDKYLFLVVHSVVQDERLPDRVLQYSRAGEFIREIGKQDTKMFKKIFCDTVDNELFVYNGKEIRHYDFSGDPKQITEHGDNVVFYHDNCFWTVSWRPQNDGSMDYGISAYNRLTAEKQTVPFNLKDKKSSANGGISYVMRSPCLSVHDNTIAVSFGLDNTIYVVRGQRLIPIVKYEIPKPKIPADKYAYTFQGFIGKYLCICYTVNMQVNLYMEDLQSGKTYIAAQPGGIADDVFDTGFCGISPLNIENHFWFVKKKNDMDETAKNKIPLKGDFIVFIVKVK